ncbi:MAG TPA: tail fiber domain-containing protein, partial [Rubrobacter sp.]|nr:tail fiber domain-containing protein [Rubrobacter sp.]
SGVGIRYNASVGLGKAAVSTYRLDVAGTINATDIRRNGNPLVESQWTSAASGDISYVGGKVGIGTAGPLYRLHVVAPGGFGGEDSEGLALAGNVPLIAQSNSTAIGIINGNGRQAFALNIDYNGGATNTRGVPTFYDKYDGGWHQCLSLKNGKVGIGTYDPQGGLDVRGDIRAGNSDIYFTRTDHNHTGIGNATGYAAIENAANYSALMILGRAGTSRGRYVRLWDYLQVNGGMDVTGYLGVGTASPQVKLHAVGNRIRVDNGGGHILDLRADGSALDLESNGADLYINNNGVPVRIRNQQSVSSRDLKENIVDFTTREAAEALEELNAVSFTWKDDGQKTRHIGFIAEDAPVIAKSTDEKAIIPVHILAILSKVVQEQQRAISAMRRQLDLREAT